jgi:hypothetical protein
MRDRCFDQIYKSPVAFRVVGKNVEASMMLDWSDSRNRTGAGCPDQWVLRDGYFVFDRTAEFVYEVSEMATLLSSPRRRS